MTKIENTGIRFKTDVFAAVAVVDAKVPYSRCRRRRRFLSSLITKRSTYISAHAHWQPLVKYLTPLSPQPYVCSSYWPSKISLQQTTVTQSIISYLSVLAWPVNLQSVSLLKSKISKKSGSLGFYVEKRNVLSKNRPFSIHFHSNKPPSISTVSSC